MKRLALFLALSSIFPATAPAQDGGRQAKAEQIVQLLHMDRTMDQMMAGMKSQITLMTNQTLGASVTAEQKAQLAKFQDQVFDYVNSQMGWKALEPEYVKLYADTFTDEELDAMIAFYRSPAGMSMIAKTPELTQKSFAISQQRMTTVMPELQKMIREFAASAASAAKQKQPAPVERN